ncbi:hypothetical protein Q3G72_034360 [Acer saccharum]|nr:hypothetical protein Q3G72_034360 [Acer saccharum]
MPTSKHGMKTRQSKEEADRVVEIGRVLGFDFSGVEEEVLEAISEREEEDNERFQAMANYVSVVLFCFVAVAACMLPFCLG